MLTPNPSQWSQNRCMQIFADQYHHQQRSVTVNQQASASTSLPNCVKFGLYANAAGHHQRHAVGDGVGGPSSPMMIPPKHQAPRFHCTECNRSYSTFNGLSKHRQFHCSSQMKRHFGCKFCERKYSSLG